MKLPDNINEKLLDYDLQKLNKNICSSIAKNAVTIITKFAREAMESYYDAYEPWLYKRTYLMLNHSYQPYFSQVGSTYSGGISIVPQNTNHPDAEYISEGDIYYSVWELGQHGYEARYLHGNDDPIYTVVPNYGKDGKPRDRFKEVEKRAYSNKTKQKLLELGFNDAKNSTYNLLHFN